VIDIAPEVAAALAAGKPVVALETSIVGQGLPAPHNLRVALDCEAAIRDEGGVPATVAVLDGKLRVGLTRTDLERIASHSRKVSSRDLGPALARAEAGATTVAATMRAAAMAKIRFMATGGIGGVHRGHPEDQSADLLELALSAVAVFCAGPKIILDLPFTVERLESLSVRPACQRPGRRSCGDGTHARVRLAHGQPGPRGRDPSTRRAARRRSDRRASAARGDGLGRRGDPPPARQDG